MPHVDRGVVTSGHTFIYKYDHKFVTECTCWSSRLFMLELSSAAGLVVQGLRSNLFGLARPFYCSSPCFGSLAACFLLGLLCGVGCCAWLLFRFDCLPGLASTSTLRLVLPGQAPPPL